MEQEVDTLDSILEVAVDVLRDYADGDDASHTRIVRLASYVTAHLGGPPYSVERVGVIARAKTMNGRAVWRCGDKLGFGDVEKSEYPANGIPIHIAEDYAVAVLRVMEPAPDDVDISTEH